MSAVPVTSSLFLSRSLRQFVTVAFLVLWMLVVSGVVLIAVWNSPRHRAVVLMAWGLIILWVGFGGLVMWRWRDLWATSIRKAPGPWGLKFVLACTLLALLEEAITTTMTNCAPLFGVARGMAYITASANYFDVVLYHSVVVFIPMFIAWAVMLRFWRFSPFAVFILFGFTGLAAETLSFGLQNLGNFAMWLLVYGLMIWLPAYSIPPNLPGRVPRWWHYLLAVFLPILFVPLAAITAPWLWLTPKHPAIHFPPIP